MENKKLLNVKQRIHCNQEVVPEPILKAPPPTPCISAKQRSGSVPDVRIVDVKKFKALNQNHFHRSLGQNGLKTLAKSFLNAEAKRSTSDHAMNTANIAAKTGPFTIVCVGPCTSDLLHSVRQKLLNL